MSTKDIMKLKQYLEESKKFSKPFEGKSYGITDGPSPKECSEYQLSRIVDMLYAAQESNLKGPEGQPLLNAVFGCLSAQIKKEFNYSKWKYTSKG